jgi:hypothetical protein
MAKSRDDFRKEMESFTIFLENEKLLSLVSDESAGKVFKRLFPYFDINRRTVPEDLTDSERLLFQVFRTDIDRATEHNLDLKMKQSGGGQKTQKDNKSLQDSSSDLKTLKESSTSYPIQSSPILSNPRLEHNSSSLGNKNKDTTVISPVGERRETVSNEPIRMTRAEAEKYYAERYRKQFVRDQMMAIDVEKGYVVITDANS